MVDAVQIAPADVLANVRVVLVNTSHPGNIGAAARAMKNMGIKHLVLRVPAVAPYLGLSVQREKRLVKPLIQQ